MLPELPAANYSVWVRGYGLVDSTPVQMKPGADAADADGDAGARRRRKRRRSIPATTGCRCSSRRPRASSPAPARRATASAPAMLTQNHWINSLKSDCNFCHQLGNQLTRSVDHVFKAKPELKTHAEAWEWRLGTGVRGTSMYAVLNNQGKDAIAEGVRRLDRAHRQGRSAAGAAAAEGRRAQPRA